MSNPRLPRELVILADEREDRPGWLRARRGVTTATQAAVIAGGHPYGTLIDVWNDKTDPEWIEEPNRYLDERADLGRLREAAILEWAGEQPEIGVKLNANAALITSPWAKGAACTPDAWALKPYNGAAKMSPSFIVVDAKTTQQNWHEPAEYEEGGKLAGVEPIGKPIGVPQHITDQMLWTFKVLRPARIYLAVEQYTWSKGTPTLVGQYIIEVPFDAVRLAYLEAKVEEFEGWLAAGIAPESDIDIRELREFEPTFDTTPEELADVAALLEVDDALTELAELQEELAPLLARQAELEAIIKAAPKVFAGRRIWLIGERSIAKLVRSNRTNLDKSRLDPAAVRAATSWSEVETVKIEPNPEWTPPADTETE